MLKKSANPALTDGNDAYSLAGAQFDIYSNALCQGEPAYTLITAEDGTTDVIEGLAPGSHWFVKETKAPQGFLPTDEVFEAVIEPGSVAVTTVTVVDDYESGSLLIRKKSADPALTQGNSSYSLEGAIFDIYDNETCQGDPAYTLTTHEDGSTDVLNNLPLGTQWWVKERVAPAGYQLSVETFHAAISETDSVVVNMEEQPITGSFSIKKISANPELTENNEAYSLEGAVFGVWPNRECSGAPTYQATTKADGTTDAIEGLPLGTQWYVKEISAPAGYQVSSAVENITIVEGPSAPVVFPDAPVWAPAQVSLVKKDDASYGNSGQATLEGAVYRFSFYAGKNQAEGEATATWDITTDANGVASLEKVEIPWAIDGQAVLPLGALTVREVTAPVGYLRSDQVFESALVYNAETQSAQWSGALADKNMVDSNGQLIAFETQKRFGISVFKKIQGVENEISPAGIQFQIIDAATGLIVETLTIDASGYAATSNRALPCGVYEVREVEATVPAGIQPYSKTSGTGDNLIATVEALDGDQFPLFQVVETGCVDYTEDTPKGMKKDRETGRPVANTQFTLYSFTGDIVFEDGALMSDLSAVQPSDSAWEEVGIALSDKHGKFDFGLQPYGYYMMAETAPEWHYLNASESAFDDQSENPLETARMFIIDKNHPCEVQVWEDTAIVLECTVDKSTIDVTSVGLVSKTSSDADDPVSNVGVEEYRYDVAFDSGNTNTYADEYWVIDELNMAAAPYDLRLTTIVTPLVENDALPTVTMLIRTNKSAGEVWNPVVETEVHEGTLCDGSSRFDGTGWRLVATVASNAAATFLVDDLGLTEGEYLTGLCLYYGAVEKDFATVAPLSYLVKASHELLEGVVIPNMATSHITRNWAHRQGSVNGLSDDDEDSVETRVLGTFEQQFDKDIPQLFQGRIGTWRPSLPSTGDGMMVVALLALMAMVASAVGSAVVRRKMQECAACGAQGGNEMKFGTAKMIGLMAVAMIFVLTLAGCSCSSQQVAASSFSASASAATSISAQGVSSTDASGSASVGENGASADQQGDVSSQVPAGNKEEASSSGPAPASSPNPAPNPAPPAHEHTWAWVSNMVTVVDQDAWDEPVYEWVDWCPTCGCQVPYTHSEDMALKGDYRHPLTERQVVTHSIHHDAVTHQEDQGAYQCSGCGAWQ